MQEHGCPGATLVSKCPDSHQQLHYISASDIIAVLWDDTTRVGAARLGFASEDVGAHSIHSDIDMAMHIAGVPNSKLMAISRWSSLGFMVYIQQQISSFSTGV